MSPRDIELWDTLLSSVLGSAGTQDATGPEILKRVANEMTGKLYVLEIASDVLRLTMCGQDRIRRRRPLGLYCYFPRGVARNGTVFT